MYTQITLHNKRYKITGIDFHTTVTVYTVGLGPYNICIHKKQNFGQGSESSKCFLGHKKIKEKKENLNKILTSRNRQVA